MIRRTLLFEKIDPTVSGNVYLEVNVVRMSTRGAIDGACFTSKLRSVLTDFKDFSKVIVDI